MFLDFDGTLAPIQDNPDTVVLGLDDSALLLSLSKWLGGALAVISGRGLADLSKRIPIDLLRLGNHGLFIAEPGLRVPEAPPITPPELLKQIEALCNSVKGVRVEPKGPVIAVHYRAAPEHGDRLGKALQQILEPVDGYKLQHGKFVYEAKPEKANKGIALTETMSRAPFSGRRPVMFGDDTTDEDAFVAAHAMGGTSVKVGVGETKAHHRLDDVSSVYEILKEFECRLKG